MKNGIHWDDWTSTSPSSWKLWSCTTSTVQDRKYMLFVEKEDDDQSDAVENIKPALAKAKARVQQTKQLRTREQKRKKAA